MGWKKKEKGMKMEEQIYLPLEIHSIWSFVFIVHNNWKFTEPLNPLTTGNEWMDEIESQQRDCNNDYPEWCGSKTPSQG